MLPGGGPRLHQRLFNRTATTPRILHSPAHATLDPLLLELISLICREYILTWYSTISRDPDRAFINQVSSVLVAVIQALEVRLAHVDLVQLVVLDLPTLLERHVRDWDDAVDKAKTGHAHNLDRDNVFHLLQPHIAVSLVPSPSGVLEPCVDRAYLRTLVTNLLNLLLPPEDFRAETERAIVREIIVNVILGNLFGRVAQPWFLYSVIPKLLDEPAERARRRADAIPLSASRTSPKVSPSASWVSPAMLFDRAYSALTTMPTLLRALAASLSAVYHTALSSPVPPQLRTLPLTTPFLGLVDALLAPSPAISQAIHYAELPLALVSGPVASLVVYVCNEKLLTSNLVRILLENSTRALFPDGHPPPRVPDPTLDEQTELRKLCEQRVAEVLPPFLVRVALPPSVPDRPTALAAHLLRPVGSHVANVHLYLLILDLVMGKLFPELLVGPED